MEPLVQGAAARGRAAQGRAVQVGSIKPTLKAPGTMHLKLKSDELPSNLAFKFNLRRYIKEIRTRLDRVLSDKIERPNQDVQATGGPLVAAILQLLNSEPITAAPS